MADPAAPLFEDFRELTLRKCGPHKREQVRRIFEKEPFGELERLVTQRLLDVAKGVAQEELESENWLRLVARLSERSYEETRVVVLEFLDTDVFHVSLEDCVCFLDPLMESWDIDLETFAVEVALNRRLTLERVKRFEFTESGPERSVEVEPGLEEFLNDPSLSGDATEEEIVFLKSLNAPGKAAYSPVLLPGAPKPAGSASFPTCAGQTSGRQKSAHRRRIVRRRRPHATRGKRPFGGRRRAIAEQRKQPA